MAHEGGHHVPDHDAEFGRSHQAGGHDKVLLTQGEELATYHPGQSRPANEREDDRDAKIDLDGGPVLGHGSAQGQPERDGGDRADELDEPLHGRVKGAPKIPGKATDEDAKGKAHGHAHQAQGGRDARPVDQPGEKITPQPISAQDKGDLGVVSGTKKAQIASKDTPQLVRIAAHKELEGDPHILVHGVDEAQRLGVAPAFQAIGV